MIQDKLKSQQKTVYQTLSNGLKNNSISHSYLFSGPKGSMMKETAYLLAQSLICNHADIFACEKCSDCHRVLSNTYVDVIYIDGSYESIKKEQIIELQDKFNKTSVEMKNRKVYIINAIENATTQALNSLLKFLEEPSSEIVAIFITSNLNKVLPTIVSRCQVIQFKSINQDEVVNNLIKQSFQIEDVKVGCALYQQEEEVVSLLESDLYLQTKDLVIEFYETLINNFEEASVLLIQKFQSKDKKTDKDELFRLFIDLSILMLKDVIVENDNLIHFIDHNELIIELNKKIKDVGTCIIKLLQIQSLLQTNTNQNLLVDSYIYQLQKEVLW